MNDGAWGDHLVVCEGCNSGLNPCGFGNSLKASGLRDWDARVKALLEVVR